jgi:IS30 family transposase
MSYKHFTQQERYCLQELLERGWSMRRIAAELERSPSSISREIGRNRAQYRPRKPMNRYWYNAWRAQNLYIRRRREKARYALNPETPQWDYIVEGLKKYWSPEAICGRWHKEHPDQKPLSVSTIYRYVRKGKFPEITVKEHLRRRGKRSLPRNSNYNSVHPDRLIPQWPREIKERERIGDWEGDTVYGKPGKGLLVTMVDRRSRYLCLGRILCRNTTHTLAAITAMMKDLPVRSISLDNGSEFSDYHRLEEELHTEVYFAEPHKPWQRGSNENINDVVRFFFPKGSNFTQVTDQQVAEVEALINNRPRKCLDWATPAEVFFKK